MHALLASAQVAIDRASLERRIADEEGGVLLSEHATLSWAIDGGAFHLYDLAGAPQDLQRLIEFARKIAERNLVAVLVVTLYAGDRYEGLLTEAGFVRDWEEPDVRGGAVRTLIGYVRELE